MSPGLAARGDRRRTRVYRRTVAATVGVLVLATAGLGIAGAFRAPHLDSASVAADTALLRAGQRLVLQSDQAIDPVTAADVRIEPEIPFDIASDGRAITIRFLGMLRTLTEYTVTVATTGTSTGVTGTLDYSFTTPDLAVAVLRRDSEGPDEVLRRSVSGTDTERLFSADRIQEFALTRDGVAAVILGESGVDGTLVLVTGADAFRQEVTLPAPGRVQQLGVSDTTGRLAFTFTSSDAAAPDAVTSRLLLVDPLDASGVVHPVVGLDGAPLSVLDWTFVPGTAYLVAHAFDGSMLLVDTADLEAPPVPLGEHAEMRGFLPGTLRLVVADPTSGSTIDLATGETRAFAPPADGLDESVYRGTLLALGDDDYVEVVSRPSGSTGFVLDYEVLLVGSEGARTIYDPDAGIPIRDVCLSPNAQYLAVEVQDSSGEPDDYPNVPGRTRTTTYFVDLATGSANRGIAGFASSWCA